MNLLRPILAAAVSAAWVAGAAAQELKIGLSAEPSAMDPHFHNLVPNNALTKHVFDRLLDQDENQRVKPMLATSWRNVDETTWEFKLRPGVKFSNGADFTANDVIFSYCRVPRVENSPSSLAINVRAITRMSAPDPLTLVIGTDKPHPLLPNELSNVAILSAKANGAGQVEFDRQACRNAGSYPKTEAFNAGEAAIGTGPYRLVRFTKGDRTILERADGYWGEKPAWARVVLRPITSAGPRVAALLAGDVDMIESVPIQDIERIKGNPAYRVVQGLSNRVIYLHFNYQADSPPGVADAGGKNPFRDKRVREAIAKAIDRDAIVARIMGGVAVAAGELLPPTMFGANKEMTAAKADPDGAKKLLAEAGYPGGFTLVLATPNDRYVNDGQIAQAVAQMLTRVGLKVSLEAMTASQFFARRNRREFGFWLAGWGSDTGEMSSPLKSLVATPNRDKGMGTTNPGGYSNPAMDPLLEQALATVDDTRRAALLAEASRTVMADFGALPLHFEMTTWAFRKDLAYTPRADQYTLGMLVRKAD
ncbi:MAG: ABC transporter substrate-binding protein [Xanthobacteraceae bacterium]|nr:ABC transporter substrate-binding protein [Xanthobacteraceae bacterium]PWB59052.1 MAG: peptide ABC transporter substrate-binding protein [Bradyrhizobiaceae bacterium]